MIKKYVRRIYVCIAMLGVLTLIASVLSATVFATQTTYTATTAFPKTAQVIITSSGMFEYKSGNLTVTATAKNPKDTVQLAIGRCDDVSNYALYGNETAVVNTVANGFWASKGKLQYWLANYAKADKLEISNVKSDIWFEQTSAKSKATLKWQNSHKQGKFCAIATVDAKTSAPALKMQWQVKSYSDYTTILLVLSVLLMLIGGIGTFYEYLLGLIRSNIVAPIAEHIEFNKAATKINELKVSDIKAYAKRQELKEKTEEKRFPSRRELRQRGRKK